MHLNVCDVCQRLGVVTPARMRKTDFDLRECYGELFPSETLLEMKAPDGGDATVKHVWPAQVQLVVNRGSETMDLCDVHALEVIDYLKATVEAAIEARDDGDHRAE